MNIAMHKQPTLRVAAVVVDGGSVLLVEHDKGSERYWVLPGGHVEPGETLAEALVRELAEEASLRIQVGPLLAVGDSISPSGHRHRVDVYFRAQPIGPTPPGHSTADPTISALRWVPLGELGRYDLRPPRLAHLVPLWVHSEQHGPTYLGNTWERA